MPARPYVRMFRPETRHVQRRGPGTEHIVGSCMLHRHAANVPIRAMSAHGQILHTQGGTAVASLVKLVQDKTGNTILPGFSRVKAFNGRLFDATSFARLAQSAERKARNLVVVCWSPTVGVFMWGCSLAGAGSGSVAPMKNWQLAQLRWPVHEEWLLRPISLIRFPLVRSRPWRYFHLPLWPLRLCARS